MAGTNQLEMGVISKEEMKPFFFLDNGNTIELTFGSIQYDDGIICDRDLILSAEEKRLYDRLKIDARQKEFLAGRYIAKRTIISQNIGYSFQEIPILNGVWGFPLIYCEGLATRGISIAHTDQLAAAIYFPQTTHPVGMDVEKIQVDKEQVLRQFIDPKEYDLVNAPSLERLFLLWSVKESAGKLLRTGFALPDSYLKIKEVNQKDKLYFVSFTILPQIAAIAWYDNHHVYSIAFPSIWKLIP